MLFPVIGLFVPSFQHGQCGIRRFDSEIPARNPHSRDVDTDPRSMVTAKTNYRTYGPLRSIGEKAKHQVFVRYGKLGSINVCGTLSGLKTEISVVI